MSTPTRLAAIVFDFDGVLANTEPLHFTVFRDVLASMQIPLTEADYYERYLGYDDVAAFQAVSQDIGRVLSDDEVQAAIASKGVVLMEKLRDPGIVFPGAKACLERFAAVVPVAIASGARREEIELVVRAHGLEPYVSTIVAVGDTPRSKPAPDPYARAVQLLARQAKTLSTITPSMCVAVEDSRWGLASARAAGLRTVAVTTSYPRESLADADVVIESLDQLTPSMVEALVA